MENGFYVSVFLMYLIFTFHAGRIRASMLRLTMELEWPAQAFPEENYCEKLVTMLVVIGSTVFL